jgi:hypothetical protein
MWSKVAEYCENGEDASAAIIAGELLDYLRVCETCHECPVQLNF